MPQPFHKILIDIKTQNKDIRLFLAHSDAFIALLKTPTISKTFNERINLAITQVNGCKLCSYAHTKLALRSGIKQDEIQYLLTGGLDQAPKEEVEALLFAQHYAESKGLPDAAIVTKLNATYSKKEVSDIMSIIYFMTLTNLQGNTIEALTLRLNGRAVASSTLGREIAVIFNVV
ncbi:MAG: carboxymuconolactone decarboxylase family protein [Bacteroidales bacterium]|jgi:AhpD family alkylhydroperoxidase|nr:carboxymuconolactone decarboxylase family protein [Bacteroidales bacterium]